MNVIVCSQSWEYPYMQHDTKLSRLLSHLLRETMVDAFAQYTLIMHWPSEYGHSIKLPKCSQRKWA